MRRFTFSSSPVHPAPSGQRVPPGGRTASYARRRVSDFDTSTPPLTSRAAATPPGFGQHAGAGNPAGPRTAKRGLLLLVFLALLAAVTAALLLIAGCTDVQRNAAADRFDGAATELRSAAVQLSGSATTRPSPLVVGVEAAVPAATPYVALAASVLSLGSFVAGVVAKGLRTGPKVEALAEAVTVAGQLVNDHKVALAEVVGDVRSFRQPTVPWSHTTGKLVADVAGLSAAAVDSSTHITDLTIQPALRQTADAGAARPAG